MIKLFKYITIIICFTVIIFQCGNSFGQNEIESSARAIIKPSKKIDSLFYKNKISELDSLHGNNKSFLPKYKLQCLIALSFYPELKSVNIDFTFKNINTTMQCQPVLSTLLKNDRSYIIHINNKTSFNGLLIDDIPFNAQIGLIGHELAHVIDYEKGNKNHIISRGFDYLSENTKKKFEYFIDSLTINHGLGWQLYDWSNYSLNNNKSSEKYKSFKRKIYMTPAIILEQIQKNSIYNEN